MPKFSNSAFILLAILISLSSFYFGNSLSSKKTDSLPKANEAPVVYSPIKSDVPELKFFVMSFCPYGNQMEDTLRPIFDTLKGKALLTPHYIFEKINDLKSFCAARTGDSAQCEAYVQNKYFPNVDECKKTIVSNNLKCQDEKSYLKSSNGTFYASLHGRQEGNQNVREICAWEQVGNNKKTWWDFIDLVNKNCTADNADTCWEQQGKAAGLDTNKITECFNKEAFSLIDKEVAITTQYKVSGSPTVLINNTSFPPESAYNQTNNGTLKIGNKIISQDKYRTPNFIKEALCASMNKVAKECNTILPDLSNTTSSTAGCN